MELRQHLLDNLLIDRTLEFVVLAVKLVRGINVHSHFAHGAEGKLIAAFLQLFIQLAELLEDGVSIIFADVIGSLPYVLGETQKSLGGRRKLRRQRPAHPRWL